MENTRKLEVHKHCFVSGPRANGGNYKFSHSHVDGDKPHQHLQTGPASYAIDKNEWLKSTGLSGGGRKKFTANPTGDQLPIQELEDWQTSFVIVVGKPTPGQVGDGPGIALPMRMILGFGMKCEVKEQC